MNKVTCLLIVVMCASVAHASIALMDRSAFDGNALKGPWGEVGISFRTGDDPALIDRLGFIDLNNDTPLDGPNGDGLQSDVTVTLWLSSDGSAVAQALVPAGTGGILYDGFRYGLVSETTLSPNTDYVLSANSGDILDSYLDANKAVTLNPLYVGAQTSDTWTIRWDATTGVMPTSTATWGVGRAYGIVNMMPEPLTMAMLGIGGLAIARRRRK